MSKDPRVDAILYHIFVGGGRKTVDLTRMAELAKAEGKPIFCWLLGHRDEAHAFQAHAQGLGIPVFRELHRAVECMAAYFQYRNPSLPRAISTSARSAPRDPGDRL